MSFVPHRRHSRITPDDFRMIAQTLIDRHGEKALGLADLAVEEMEDQQDDYRAEAWKTLRSEIADMLDGRACKGVNITLH